MRLPIYLSAIVFMLVMSPALGDARKHEPLHGDIPKLTPFSDTQRDYVKQEAMIPMRDGVKLYTLILMRKQGPVSRPLLLERTPYGTGAILGEDNASTALTSLIKPLARLLIENDFILVYQDVRGKHKSQGEYFVYEPPRGAMNTRGTDHSTDAYDTVDWLVKNVRGNSGNVGIMGASYGGYTTLMALLTPHAALKAAVPVNPVVDLWMGDDFYHNGAFRMTELEWIAFQSSAKISAGKIPYGSFDVYPFYLSAGSASEAGRRVLSGDLPAWRKIGSQATYGAFWQERALDRHLAKVDNKVPTLIVHSLFDQEDNYGAPAVYAALEKSDTANDTTYFVAGPWAHGQSAAAGSTLGPFDWHQDTAKFYREKILLPFLNKHLRGIEPEAPIAPVTAFDTGRKQWVEQSSWPTSGTTATSLYLDAGSSVALHFPPEEAAGDGFDEYTSDPAKPIPYRNRPIGQRMLEGSGWYEWLVEDQRPASSRPDVLTYVSAPLETDVTIAGGISAELFAATSGTDSDWVVKLIDVFPEEYPDKPRLGGYQLMISGDILRGRYRRSFENAAPITPDAVERYEVRMPHAFHTFLRGHRIMVQIQSSWFPLYDRNPQSYVASIFEAPANSYVAARQRIYRQPRAASRLLVPIARPPGDVRRRGADADRR